MLKPVKLDYRPILGIGLATILLSITLLAIFISNQAPARAANGTTIYTNGQFQVRYTIDSQWNSGYTLSVTIVNNSSTAVAGWTIGWQLAPGESLGNAWNTSCSKVASKLSCTNQSYNGNLTANGGTSSFGGQFSITNGVTQPPGSLSLNGISLGANSVSLTVISASSATITTAVPTTQVTTTPNKTVSPTATASPAVTKTPQLTTTTPPTATTTPGSSSHRYGTFNAVTQIDMNDWKKLGGTIVNLEAYWDRLQSGPGAALNSVEVANLNNQIATAQSLGLQVSLSVAIQYPPQWIKDSVSSYKNQSGKVWTGGIGEDVRDWVWNDNGRSYVKDFISKTLAAVDLTKISYMRLGGGYYNELHYNGVEISDS